MRIVMKRTVFCILFWGLSLFLYASGDREAHGGQQENDGRPLVFASNYPLTFLCEYLAGDKVQILNLQPEDEDPAFWIPRQEDLQQMQQADLILLNGADYENWVNYSFLDPLVLEDTSRFFRDMYIESDRENLHSHGNGNKSGSSGTAFTLWLDLSLYAQQAESVFKALERVLPHERAALEERYGELSARLDSLHSLFLDAGRVSSGHSILASHPIYQYFSRAYLGEVYSVLWEPHLYPSDEEWASLRQLKEEHQAEFMIWEAEPMEEIRRTLSDMGLQWIVVSPGFNREESLDFLDIITGNLDYLVQMKEFYSEF